MGEIISPTSFPYPKGHEHGLDDLYASDFYAWTRRQAELCAAPGPSGQHQRAIDWAHLAEEVGIWARSSAVPSRASSNA